MTGEEILKALLVKINDHYQLNIEDFNDTVEIEDIDTIIDILTTNATLLGKNNICDFLKNFTKAKVGSDYFDDEYYAAQNKHLIDFTIDGFNKRHRPFSYADQEFGFLSFQKLFSINPLSDLHTHAADFKVLLDYTSTAIVNSDDTLVTDLLNYIEIQSTNYGILVEWIPNTAEPLPTYSYLFYKKLLAGEVIEIDSSLHYNCSHGATATFNTATIYQQYFEVFDIVNELNQAKDIITRYLKLYHIIEYLVYRVELVKAEKNARLNRTFIREIHKLTGQKTGEMALLQQCLKKVFHAEIQTDYFDLGQLTQDQCDFLHRYWGVEYGPTTLKIAHKKVESIAKLIYGIRNSIVHNKESEFHLTTTNPAEYLIIIPIIKSFMQKLEKIVLDKISADVAELSYKSPNIQLY